MSLTPVFFKLPDFVSNLNFNKVLLAVLKRDVEWKTKMFNALSQRKNPTFTSYLLGLPSSL